MAYATPVVDPNAVNPGTPSTQSTTQQPVQTGGTGGAGAVGAKAAPAVAGVNTPLKPSVSLSDYLTTNQPQTNQLAGTIAGNLAGQGTAAQNAINSAVGTYTQGLNPVAAYQGILNQIVSNPTAVASNPTAAQQFGQMYNAEQSAPNIASTFESSAPYQSLSQQVQTAVNNAALWNQGNNISNIQTAVQPLETNPTAGNVTLDSLLLAQTPGAYNQIQNAAAPTANLPGQLTQQTNAADQALQSAIAQDTATQNAAQGAASTANTNLINGINSEYQNALNQANTYNTEVQQYQTQVGNDVTQANSLQNLLSQYGAYFFPYAGPGNYANWRTNANNTVPWINPSSITTPSTVGLPNEAQVATPQDYATLQALSQLEPGANINAPINATNAAQAGTYQGPGTLDTSPLRNDLQGLVNFIASPQAQDVYVTANGNVNPFAAAGNNWYTNLVNELTALGGTNNGVNNPFVGF
jgi:hypothetical protein